jgi:hypothetical protein
VTRALAPLALVASLAACAHDPAVADLRARLADRGEEIAALNRRLDDEAHQHREDLAEYHHLLDAEETELAECGLELLRERGETPPEPSP